MAVLALTGCNFFVPNQTTTSGGSSTGNYVYIANNGANSIGAFAIGTGSLTAVTGEPFALGYAPVDLTVTPKFPYLYVAGAGGIYGYSIATSTGALTSLNSGSPIVSAVVASLDVSPDGKFLVGLDRNSAVIDEYAVNTTNGTLTLQATVPYSAATLTPTQIRFAPNGTLLVATLGTSGDLSAPYTEATGLIGTPTVYNISAATTQDNALTIDPNAAYVYIARTGTQSGIVTYPLTSSGIVASGGSITSTGTILGTASTSILLSSSGSSLFVGDSTSGQIYAFTVATGAALTSVAGSPFTTGSGRIALAKDSTGTYIAAAAQGGAPDLTLYTISSTIAGKPLPAASAATGTDPVSAISVAFTR